MKTPVVFALLVMVAAGVAAGLEWRVRGQAKSADTVPRLPATAPDDPGRPLTLRWLGPPSFPAGQEGLWVERRLEERFHLELRPIFLDPTAYQRKKPLLLASGAIPDVIWESDPLTLQKAVHHRFLAEVPPELLFRHAPSVCAQLLDEAPEAWLYSAVGGGNYGLPTFNSMGWRPRPGLWRMDWLRNVGLERPPETLPEFEEALRRLSQRDPDGDGRDDTRGMTGDVSHWWWASFTEIFGAFGVLPYDWQEVGGRVVWGGTRPETREALALLRRWYAEGLIHPDFVTDNSNLGQSVERKFLNGQVGYVNYRAGSWELYLLEANSLHAKLLNLNFEEVLRTQEGWLSGALADLPLTLLLNLRQLRAEQLLAQPPPAWAEELLPAWRATLQAEGLASLPPAWEEQARSLLAEVPAGLRQWMVEGAVRDAYYRARAAVPPVPVPPPPSLAESLRPGPTGWSDTWPFPVRRTLLLALRQRLLEELAREFPPAREARWAEVQGPRILSVLPGPAAAVPARLAETVEDLRRGESDPVLEDLLASAAENFPTAPTAVHPRRLREVIFQDVRFKIHHKVLPPVLVAAPFPEGPRGNRGARSWGRAGNIITFGRPVARQPEKAVRTLTMFEEFFRDRDLYRESSMGRYGLHWDWADPEIGPGRGVKFRKDYRDPATGTPIDLTRGTTALRLLLNPDLSFFNLVGGPAEFRDYFRNLNDRAFEDTYQRPEWALLDVLGKPDVVPSAGRYLGDLRSRQQTIFAEIIRGDRPLADFDRFVTDWSEQGGAILTAEANQMRAELDRILTRLRRLRASLAPSPGASAPPPHVATP